MAGSSSLPSARWCTFSVRLNLREQGDAGGDFKTPVERPAQLSLSRLHHGQPGVQAHPEIVQGATELHHQVTDTLLPQAHPVFDDATPFDAAVDMLDPEPPLVERLVGQVLLR